MPHWLIKSATQRVISWLPYSQWWNEQFQRHVTRSLELDAGTFDLRVRFAQRHFAQLLAARSGRPGAFTTLELGTGWYPVVPIGLWLCGAEKIWTYDIASLINADRLHATFARFLEGARTGALNGLLPAALAPRVAQLGKLWERSRTEAPVGLLASIGIDVRVQDAQQTGLGPGSVDLFTSTAVLEYIPRPVLAALWSEFRRVARPGAVSSHYVNLADQYHYFDRSISPLNFLRFSERQWRLYNSPLTPLNRLRYSDHLDLFRAGGWRVVCAEPSRGSDTDLERVPLAPEFRRYAKQDLLVLTAFVAAQLEPFA